MVEIREIHDPDVVLEALECVGGSLFDQTVNQPETLQALGRKYAEKANVITVISDSQMAGLCAFYDNDQESAFISMMVVIGEYQHRGYGTLLLREVIRRCRVEETKSLRLEVSHNNQKAIEFYKKNGFQMREKKAENLIMELKLL